ncbi:MAG: response regulator [Thermomicrobiales bacterium]
MDGTPGPGDAPSTILLVEDEPSIATLVQEALCETGHRVVVTPTLNDALTTLTGVRYALILADTAGTETVTGGDPWASLDQVRRAAGPTPVVIFTAHQPSLFANWPDRGFAGFIAKPFDLDDLAAQVAGYLGDQAPGAPPGRSSRSEAHQQGGSPA